MNRALLTGWAKISGGNAASALLRLVALAIAARGLDVTVLGIIVLIEAYVRVIDGLLNFQSVNVMTRFLAERSSMQSDGRFCGLVKAGLLIDGVTAMSTCALAIGLLPIVGTLAGIPGDWSFMAGLFCLVILTRILGTSESVLRCFNRFWAIGMRDTINATIMVCGSLIAWELDAGANVYLLVWLGAEVVANGLFIAWTFVVLRQHGMTGIWSADALAAIRNSPGFWKMLWQTNLTFGLRTLSQYGDLLIAGAILGPTAVSLLRVAKNVSAILSQFGRPLQQVASAAITRFWSENKPRELFSYVLNICVIAGTVGLSTVGIFVLIGESILLYAFGAEFVGATVPLILLLVANAVYLAGITLLPTMLTIDMSTEFLLGVVFGTVAYAIFLAIAIAPLGNVGIALAHIALSLVWATYCWRKVVLRLARAV